MLSPKKDPPMHRFSSSSKTTKANVEGNDLSKRTKQKIIEFMIKAAELGRKV